MRIFSLIPVLAALATAVAGLAVSRDVGCEIEMKCNSQPPAKRDFSSRPVARSVDGFSNAELLRRGLSPKGPVMRRGVFPYL